MFQLFRKRFRIPFPIFKKICVDLKPILQPKDTNATGVEAIPFTVKVLACLRRLGRGEVWDTIVELCQDKVSEETLRIFFKTFVYTMKQHYGEEMIHPPQSDVELQSVLRESAKKGYPGCIGFMDGVHCRWEMCPARWRHLSLGKESKHPSIGWQCTVNHKRRFISVMSGLLGSVNDVAACKADPFVHALRNNPLYTDQKVLLYDVNGNTYDEQGLWVSVDGGYLKTPELLVGDPNILDLPMNHWTSYMESERKHVECAFGILKHRFRILKLPIVIHDVDDIDNMFFTCCILHNMCLDFDGADDGWNLGEDDGMFSDDPTHDTYLYGGMRFDLYPHVDCSTVSSLYGSNVAIGTDFDSENFQMKRERIAQHFYYRYRHHGLLRRNK